MSPRLALLAILLLLVGGLPAGVASVEEAPGSAKTASATPAGADPTAQVAGASAEHVQGPLAQRPLLDLAGELSTPASLDPVAALEAQREATGSSPPAHLQTPASPAPSAALARLADQVGTPIPATDASGLATLDAADASLDGAITRVVDAFAAMSQATEQGLADVDLSHISTLSDEVAPGFQHGESLPLRAPDDASAPFAGPSAEQRAGAEPLAETGIDLQTLTAARIELLETIVDLDRTFGVSGPIEHGTNADGHVDLCPLLAFDLAGQDSTYEQDCILILDVGGDNRYRNNAGGSGVSAPGLPGFREDPCAIEIEPGAPEGFGLLHAPAAALVDLGEGDGEYGDPADPRACGANGGGFLGTGFLYDGGGDDVYVTEEDQPNGGTNGGGTLGTGFLYDDGGDDTYVGGSGAANGGASVGVGSLVDRRGDDVYEAETSASNGGATAGVGMLVDGAGTDTYLARGTGVNGGADVGGLGALLDAGGDDAYLVEPTDGGTANANGGASSTASVPAAGTLWDGQGTDRYRDDQVPGGECRDCTVTPKGIAGIHLDSDELPRDRVQEACRDRERHPPIRIVGDQSATGFAVREGAAELGTVHRPGSGVVAGNGTAENPFLIEGWCIEAPPGEAAIHVEGTSAHLLVDDTVLVGETPTAEAQGIVLEDADNVRIEDNEIVGTHVGVLAEGASDLTIRDNAVHESFRDGVVVDASQDVLVVDNAVRENVRAGILASASADVAVRENTLDGNRDGLVVLETGDALVAQNTATVHREGLLAIDSPGLQVRANALAANGGTGLFLQESHDADVEDNELAGATRGALALSSDRARFANNTLEGAPGLFLEGSEDAAIHGNDLGRGLLLRAGSVSRTIHEVGNDNTVLGEPLRYVADEADVDVTAPAGQVIVADAANVSVHDVSLTGATEAVQVLGSRNVTVENVSAEDSSSHGIRSWRSQAITFANVTVRHSQADGIRLFGVSEPRIEHGTLEGNAQTGAWLQDAPGAVVSQTTAGDNGRFGLAAILAPDAQARGNTLDGNGDIGLLSTSDGSLVANNTARGNTGPGIGIFRAEGVSVQDNLAEGNQQAGVTLFQVEDTVAEHNRARANPIGLLVEEGNIGAAFDTRVEANELGSNGVGVLVDGRIEDLRLRDNNIEASSEGTGLDASGAGSEVDARHNWWGCPAGPDADGCDDVEGQAAVEPWLTARDPTAGPR